jgi:hypothetical protein
MSDNTVKSDRANTKITSADNGLPVVHLWKDINLQGDSITAYGSVAYVGDDFNDQASSIVIERGYWNFYVDINYMYQTGPTLGPGEYDNVTDYCIQNDAISSFKFVGFTKPA